MIYDRLLTTTISTVSLHTITLYTLSCVNSHIKKKGKKAKAIIGNDAGKDLLFLPLGGTDLWKYHRLNV